MIYGVISAVGDLGCEYGELVSTCRGDRREKLGSGREAIKNILGIRGDENSELLRAKSCILTFFSRKFSATNEEIIRYTLRICSKSVSLLMNKHDCVKDMQPAVVAPRVSRILPQGCRIGS